MERIIVDPNILCGKPVIRGSRISVEFVLDRIGEGWSIEQFVEQYPGITADDVRACIAYAGHVLRSEHVYPVPA